MAQRHHQHQAVVSIRQCLQRSAAAIDMTNAEIGRAFAHCPQHFAAQMLFEIDFDCVVATTKGPEIFGQKLNDR